MARTIYFPYYDDSFVMLLTSTPIGIGHEHIIPLRLTETIFIGLNVCKNEM
jgi:hypothetical protein